MCKCATINIQAHIWDHCDYSYSLILDNPFTSKWHWQTVTCPHISVSTFYSMLPLLIKDGLIVASVATSIAFTVLMLLTHEGVLNSLLKKLLVSVKTGFYPNCTHHSFLNNDSCLVVLSILCWHGDSDFLYSFSTASIKISWLMAYFNIYILIWTFHALLLIFQL